MSFGKDLLLRYILGECRKEEIRKVESAYFANPAMLRELNAMTDDLVADYVSNSMAPALRRRFERCLESKPYIRDKVRKAKR